MLRGLKISSNGSYAFFQSYDYLKGYLFKNQNNLNCFNFYKNKIIAFLPLEIRKLFSLNFTMDWNRNFRLL